MSMVPEVVFPADIKKLKQNRKYLNTFLTLIPEQNIIVLVYFAQCAVDIPMYICHLFLRRMVLYF